MPSLAQHSSQKIVKVVMVGDSGSGKSGTVASLAKAGYRLRVLDFDNGMDIVYALLKSDPKALAQVEYETLIDKIKNVGGAPMYQNPDAFSRAMKLLDKWPDGSSVSTWGEQDVLVIDSFTFMGKAAMNYALMLSGHLNDQPTLPDWGSAMRRLEDFLALLQSDQVKCNVVLICHINYVENEATGVLKGYPNALGQKLSPRIGAYFNHGLLVQAKGQGQTRVRSILTKGDGLIDCKSPVLNCPAILPIETGLADYFKLARGVQSVQLNIADQAQKAIPSPEAQAIYEPAAKP